MSRRVPRPLPRRDAPPDQCPLCGAVGLPLATTFRCGTETCRNYEPPRWSDWLDGTAVTGGAP